MSAARTEAVQDPLHGNTQRDPETIRRIVALAATHSYAQIATMTGIGSRNVVAGIVHRAARGHYHDTVVVEAQQAKAERRRQLQAESHERHLGWTARVEAVNARRRAKRAAEALAAGRVPKPSVERPLDPSRFRTPPSMSWAERGAKRAAAASLPVRGLTLLEMGRNDCRWPLTEIPNTRFCALPAVPGKSYCDCHQAVALRGFQK